MCAYNSINGQPACANEFLLQDQLRGKWDFKGYVVSDCDAVVNIFRDHHFTKTQPKHPRCPCNAVWTTSALTLSKVKGRPRLSSRTGRRIKQGILKESEIDTALVRLFTARMKLGMSRSTGDGPLLED